jgi:hypothetical protein
VNNERHAPFRGVLQAPIVLLAAGAWPTGRGEYAQADLCAGNARVTWPGQLAATPFTRITRPAIIKA